MTEIVRLTTLLGRQAVAPDGRRLGRVGDLLVSLDQPHPIVTGVLVRDGGRLRRHAWRGTRGGDALVVAGGPGDPRGELRLARDVLDSQIVDVRGRRVVRAGDVELAERDGELRVVAVDAGFGAVLRRLGLRRLARAGGRDAIDWADVHIARGTGHAMQLASPAAAVHRLTAAELSALVARLPAGRGAELLAAVEPGRARAARASPHPRRRRFPHRRSRRAPA